MSWKCSRLTEGLEHVLALYRVEEVGLRDDDLPGEGAVDVDEVVAGVRAGLRAAAVDVALDGAGDLLAGHDVEELEEAADALGLVVVEVVALVLHLCAESLELFLGIFNGCMIDSGN